MTHTPLTLIELMAAHPSLFYRQAWYAHEAFLRALPNERTPRTPKKIIGRGAVPFSSKGLPLAVDLANAYVRDPLNPIWDDYIWTRDTDAQGQRVYVGGCANGHAFEIHRHIHISDRFGIPQWT